MPSKKQRRRRDKERRHDYEYVYVDSEGNEVEGDEPEAVPPAPQKQAAKATAKPAARRARGGRPIRKVDPPNWHKVLRRAAIFAPVMFVVVYLLKPKSLSVLGVVYQTAVLMAFFIPFSYLMDRMMYRTYLRRTGQEPPRAQPRGR